MLNVCHNLHMFISSTKEHLSACHKLLDAEVHVYFSLYSVVTLIKL